MFERFSDEEEKEYATQDDEFWKYNTKIQIVGIPTAKISKHDAAI